MEALDKLLQRIADQATRETIEQLAKRVYDDGTLEVKTKSGLLRLSLNPIIDFSSLYVGQQVHYQPRHYKSDQWENGIIKEIPTHTDTAVRVVYNCNNDWDNYQHYNSALTNLEDLKLGWRHPDDNEDSCQSDILSSCMCDKGTKGCECDHSS